MSADEGAAWWHGLRDSPKKTIFFLLFALLLFWQVGAWWQNRRLVSKAGRDLESLKTYTVGKPVDIYGPAKHPVTYVALVALELRGLDYELIPIKSVEGLKQSAIWSRIESSNMMSMGRIPIPIFDMADQLYGPEQFHQALESIPIDEEAIDDQIRIYAPSGDPQTEELLEQLEEVGLPFIEFDYRSAEARGDLTARVRAFGGPEKGQFPFVIVGKQVFTNPEISDVEAAYSPSH